MSILRFASRSFFSGHFIVDGYQLLTKPDQTIDQVSGTIERVTPVLQSVLPSHIADKVPTNVRTWTRLLGAAQIVGGVAYATGIGRRPGAVLLTIATIPRTIGTMANGKNDREAMLTQVALLGGTLAAAQDTAGKPSLVWHTQQARKAAGKHANRSRDTLSQNTEQLGDMAHHVGKSAKKKAARLTDQVEPTKKKAKEKAGKSAKKAQEHAKKVHAHVDEVLN